MDRLKVKDGAGIIYTGGMPFDLEDIDWMDRAVREAFTGILTGFGTGYRLNGCRFDPVLPTVFQGGYLNINGEVYHVNSGTIPTLNPGEQYFWAPVITHDVAGDEPFEDSVTRSTYEVRKATLISGTPTFDRLPLNAPTILELINDYVQSNLVLTIPSSGWHEVGGVSEPAFASGWANKGGVFDTLAFKSEIGRVYFKGTIWVNPTDASGLSVVFTLPAAYRPTKSKLMAITARYDTVSNYVAVPMVAWVDSITGNVSLYTTGAIAQSSLQVGWDGVFFDL